MSFKKKIENRQKSLWRFAPKLNWYGACMVPNKLVHSAELPLEHERAYARLFGKLEYTFKNETFFGNFPKLLQ